MKTQIQIPTPCHENWNQMTPVDKGRFCQSCQKNVIDFTTASDRQIIEHLQNNSNVCGRFRVTQLDRDLILPQQKSTIWTAAFAGFVSLFVLNSNQASAQTKQEWVRTYRDKEHISGYLKKTAGETPIQSKIPFKINGVVVKSGIPVPTATIAINNKNFTQTDFDGLFSIEARPGDTLRVSFVGYLDYETTVTESREQILVELGPPTMVLGGEVAVGGFTATRLSFVKRQLWRIRNWFR